MLDGSRGAACRMAMELLVRYGEALGVEDFVPVTNIAGVPGQATAFLRKYYQAAGGDFNAIFSLFDLDADEVVTIPPMATSGCHLQGGVDPRNWRTLGASEEAAAISRDSEQQVAAHGIDILKTCTPYLSGNVPAFGEHCAWMESSAIVYCNAVLGARTNVEGRESTSAAMLTGRIPNFGLHIDHCRRGTHRIDVAIDIDSVQDWGMLGYYAGKMIGERIPVVTGPFARPDLLRHKHFGAAAASSGGVEMYHVVGATPEAPDVETAFGPNTPMEIFCYGTAERRAIYEDLNVTATDPAVDFVMLGCPHYAIEQIAEVCNLLQGRRISASCRLWLFTSRAVRDVADRQGLTQRIQDAGGVLLTDTCSAIGLAVPPGTRVAALDSAKQAHYLPAMLGVQAWFGSMRDCIDAAVTGYWHGVTP